LISRDVKEIALAICTGIASPRSLAVSILLENQEWDQLASLRVDPMHYLTSEAYWGDAQATSLLQKYEPLETTFDRKKAAEESFVSCELECLRTNIRIYPFLEDILCPQYGVGVSEFIVRTRKIISDILGPLPSILDGRFGPGATYGDKGVMTTIPDKISSVPTFTSDAWPYLFQWSGTSWAKFTAQVGKGPLRVDGNRFTTVPKDCTKHRGIAIEPSINVFYQLGLGRVIRARLKRWGIDLNEGQEKHRQLACASSRNESLATIDLSNASDTICRNLVKLLLPPPWYEALDDLRSKKTLFNGSWRVLEKFSSMGNGFTFELETLIFLALSLSVTGRETCGSSTLVYGDDIIIPSCFSKDVISVLAFFGLKTNARKSFVKGPFRESCGGDFFNGRAVRPFYLKDDPDQPHKLIALANGLKRSCNNDPFRFHSLYHAWLRTVNGLPRQVRRLRGPQGLGDLVIHDEQSSWQYRWRHGIRLISCYAPSSHREVLRRGFSEDAVLAATLYGVDFSSGVIHPRDSVLDYRIKEVPFS